MTRSGETLVRMLEPIATRPHMPGYGTLPADQGSGLLPWSWAVDRLTRSHDYWVATVRPDGAPHVMPVWGVWLDDAVWFSSALSSRKARNPATNARCSVATDDAHEPVVLEGHADQVSEHNAMQRFTDAVNAKYDATISLEFYAGSGNGVWRVPPGTAFALTEDDFTGSPTRWRF